jgi:hypothetical protein
MPPIKTQVSCPNCRMPVMTNLEQLFDVTQDPSAKQRFLSGRFNLIQCPNCRFQGQAATVLLYHDADKEILMSYAPMELGLPQAEQERVVGKLMNEVINKLPQEKRKGYLLSPKAAFTLQGLMERVLEADGITKEMLDAQRAKAQIAQKFLAAPEAQWPEMVKEHDAQMDAAFFQMLTASAESTFASGNQGAAQQMLAIRNKLMELSTFGATAREQQKKIEAAARQLQDLGDKLTQDKLLEMVLAAEDEITVAAYVSLARPAMDYAFFEALTRRIDRAAGAEKDRLAKVREQLLKLTQEIDQAEQARVAEAAQLLKELMEAPDLQAALLEAVPDIDDTFMAVLNANMEAATKAKRRDVYEALQRINDAIMKMVQESAPPEIRLVNELLQIETEEVAVTALKSRMKEVNLQQLVEAMTYIVESLRQSGQPAAAERLEKLRVVALGEAMAANWKK